MDAELTLRFADTSLDPYVRFFEPRLSPFTTAVAGGTIRVVGELANVDHLRRRDARREPRPEAVRLSPAQRGADRPVARPARRSRSTSCAWSARAPSCRSRGRSTCRSQRARGAGVGRRQPRHPAGLLPRPAQPRHRGDQGGDQRRRSTSRCSAGSADITDGRIRVLSVPHSLEAINGRISFDARRRPARRRGGAAGRGRRAIRRPDRHQRLHARRPEPDRHRRADAHPLPGGVRLDHRREPGAAGHDGRAGAERQRAGARRVLVAADRSHARTSSTWPAAAAAGDACGRSRRPRRFRCASTSTSTRRPPCGSRTTSPRWSRAPT